MKEKNPPWQMTKKYSAVLLTTILILCVFSSGCASTRAVITETETGNKKLTADNILKIKKGVSSTQEIKEIFGDPDVVLENNSIGYTTWVYHYALTKQSSLDRTPFQEDQTQLEITFNTQGVVTSYTQTVANRLKKSL